MNYTATTTTATEDTPLSVDMLLDAFDAMDKARIVQLGFTPDHAEHIVRVSRMARVDPLRAAKLLRRYQLNEGTP